MDEEPHPDGCMCEDCKDFRALQEMRDGYPERARELSHIRGQDSEPDPYLSGIPEGMTERDARAHGYI